MSETQEDRQLRLVRQAMVECKLERWMGYSAEGLRAHLADILWEGWKGADQHNRPEMAQWYIGDLLELENADAYNRVMEMVCMEDDEDYTRQDVWDFVVADASLRVPGFQ